MQYLFNFGCYLPNDPSEQSWNVIRLNDSDKLLMNKKWEAWELKKWHTLIVLYLRALIPYRTFIFSIRCDAWHRRGLVVDLIGILIVDLIGILKSFIIIVSSFIFILIAIEPILAF